MKIRTKVLILKICFVFIAILLAVTPYYIGYNIIICLLIIMLSVLSVNFIQAFLDSYSDLLYIDNAIDQDIKNQYFKEVKNGFHLINKNIIVIYDDRKYKLIVQNLSDNKKFYVSSAVFKPTDIFITIAKYFDTNTTYNTILSKFQARRGVDAIVDGEKYNRIREIKSKIPQNKLSLPIITINSYSQEDFAKLPGINIAGGKKAIKYRSEHNGFKTKEEFYKVVKLKKYFIEMLDSSIIIDDYDVLNEYQIEEIETQLQEGRQVDF